MKATSRPALTHHVVVAMGGEQFYLKRLLHGTGAWVVRIDDPPRRVEGLRARVIEFTSRALARVQWADWGFLVTLHSTQILSGGRDVIVDGKPVSWEEIFRAREAREA